MPWEFRTSWHKLQANCRLQFEMVAPTKAEAAINLFAIAVVVCVFRGSGSSNCLLT
jgi:hypothetical protein